MHDTLTPDVPTWAEPATSKQARDVRAGEVLVFQRPGSDPPVARPLLVLSSEHGLDFRMKVEEDSVREVDGVLMGRQSPAMVLTQVIRLMGVEDELHPEWDDWFCVRIPS